MLRLIHARMRPVTQPLGVWVMVTLLLAGCARYHDEPLQPAPLRSLEALQTDTSAHPEWPPRWRRKINLQDGVNGRELVQLALLNSPHLAAVARKLPEAKAQLEQAGLLPDPQLHAAVDLPRGGDPTLVTGVGLGLGFDLQAWVTRDAKQSAASAQAKATYLQLLWQQWQVVQQARILYRRALIQQQQLALTARRMRQMMRNWQLQQQALQHGNATRDREELARVSAMDAEAAWYEAKRQYNTTMHTLAQLLGLAPEVLLPLTPPAAGLASLLATPPKPHRFRQMWLAIDHHRPDLLALQAGYAAQQALVRQQILAQFPSFTLGVNTLRDTGNIWTLGPFVQLHLPLWNGNRGQIAVARATRSRLRAEYQDRLNSARIEADRLYRDQQLARAEFQALEAKLPTLTRTMRQMQQALAHGNIDMLTFTTLQNSQFNQQMKVLQLKQALLEQAVALDTLLGQLPLPPAKGGADQ